MSHEHSDLCGFCVTGELSTVKVVARYPGVDEVSFTFPLALVSGLNLYDLPREKAAG